MAERIDPQAVVDAYRKTGLKATTGWYLKTRTGREQSIRTRHTYAACAIGVLRRGVEFYGFEVDADIDTDFYYGFDRDVPMRDSEGYRNGREVRAAVEAAGIEFV